ncbi:MAG: hypothetical protein KA116_12450 [Proteobacteria bacterium]|nr:hypothetical protein [Pseudomonadota bacterium]
MSERHPLKRKSVKPSSSTVRGMLPAAQFQCLDAAMQSLRAVGLRFDWVWGGASLGWICAGLIDDKVSCEILAGETPLLGRIVIKDEDLVILKASSEFPEKFKKFLDFPVEQKKGKSFYELEIDTTAKRDVFSEVVRSIDSSFGEIES